MIVYKYLSVCVWAQEIFGAMEITAYGDFIGQTSQHKINNLIHCAPVKHLCASRKKHKSY